MSGHFSLLFAAIWLGATCFAHGRQSVQWTVRSHDTTWTSEFDAKSKALVLKKNGVAVPGFSQSQQALVYETLFSYLRSDTQNLEPNCDNPIVLMIGTQKRRVCPNVAKQNDDLRLALGLLN